MIRRLVFALLSLICLAGPLGATSYADPERREVCSENRKFLMIVDPEQGVTVEDASDPGKVLWSFRAAIWHQPFFLSNDGQTVAEVAWLHIGEEALTRANCVSFHGSDGSTTGVPFLRVCADPPRTQDVGGGPIGRGWRTWYQEADRSGDILDIHTTRGMTARFDLAKRKLVSIRNRETKEIPDPSPEPAIQVLPLAATIILTGGAIGFLIWKRQQRRRLALAGLA